MEQTTEHINTTDVKRKKRRRLSPPRTLVLFGIAFLLFPFVNYFALAYTYRQPFTNPGFLLQPPLLPSLGLFILAFIVGIGLLRVQKWGWWSFQVFAVLLIGYNLYLLFNSFNAFNSGALFRAVLGMAAVYYFSRKDISAPYMKLYPRGWRMQKRTPLHIPVTVNGTSYNTCDFSPTGFYALMDRPAFELNQEVKVKFELDGEEFKYSAGVVRLDEDGAGIALRDLPGGERRKIRGLLRNMSKTSQGG